MKNKPSINKTELGYCLLITISAFLFLLFFSVSTSPRCANIGFDSNIFNVIGREWAHGGLPYITVWDSKGPYIYFINMLGYKLTDSTLGIFIIQFVNLTVTLLLLFYMVRRYISTAKALGCLVLFFFIFTIVSEGGNQVSEYSLIPAVASTLFAYRWSRGWNDGDAHHPWQYALVYGIFFGLSFMSRLTNAIPLAMWSAIIFFVLCYNRLWHNLLENIIAFIIGFAIIFVPFAIYFLAHGAFGEMWYATLTYNLEYVAESTEPDEDLVTRMDHVKAIIKFLFNFSCVLSLLLYSISSLLTNRKSIKFSAMWAIVSAVTLLWLINSFASNVYAITFVPLVFIPFIDTAKSNGKPSKLVSATLYFTVVLVTLGFANFMRYGKAILNYAPNNETASEVRLTEMVPKGDTFVIYDALPYVYVATGQRPCYRYFVCQDWAIKNGPSLKPKVIEQFKTLKAKWILVKQDKLKIIIEDILDKHYKVVYTDKKNKVRLMKLK